MNVKLSNGWAYGPLFWPPHEPAAILELKDYEGWVRIKDAEPFAWMRCPRSETSAAQPRVKRILVDRGGDPNAQ
ncbi:hypothetical protein XCCB100_3116 [Xanthomonas campestris pv. campestris]|uniref:Uncharacterized protein n=1 Tax=Xanthomonas campestris pv. campestris (strain B100) TaxID=509169 RepID=B0RXB5_XANCB|nr:hypothetical protein XCCB100_3116 [Xanthomonas campestris pv. campestris]